MPYSEEKFREHFQLLYDRHQDSKYLDEPSIFRKPDDDDSYGGVKVKEVRSKQIERLK